MRQPSCCDGWYSLAPDPFGTCPLNLGALGQPFDDEDQAVAWANGVEVVGDHVYISHYNEDNPGSDLRFILPSDHTQLTGRLEIQFNRRGYSVTGNAAFSRRSTTI